MTAHEWRGVTPDNCGMCGLAKANDDGGPCPNPRPTKAKAKRAPVGRAAVERIADGLELPTKGPLLVAVETLAAVVLSECPTSFTLAKAVEVSDIEGGLTPERAEALATVEAWLERREFERREQL